MKLSEMFENYIEHLRLYNSSGYVSFISKEYKSIKEYFKDVDSSEIDVNALKKIYNRFKVIKSKSKYY